MSNKEEVKILVKEIDTEKHLLKANLVLNDEKQQTSNNTGEDDKGIDYLGNDKKKKKRRVLCLIWK